MNVILVWAWLVCQTLSSSYSSIQASTWSGLNPLDTHCSITSVIFTDRNPFVGAISLTMLKIWSVTLWALKVQDDSIVISKYIEVFDINQYIKWKWKFHISQIWSFGLPNFYFLIVEIYKETVSLPIVHLVGRIERVLGHFHEPHCFVDVLLLHCVGQSQPGEGGGQTEDGQQSSGRGECGVLAISGFLSHFYVSSGDVISQVLWNHWLLLFA